MINKLYNIYKTKYTHQNPKTILVCKSATQINVKKYFTDALDAWLNKNITVWFGDNIEKYSDGDVYSAYVNDYMLNLYTNNQLSMQLIREEIT